MQNELLDFGAGVLCGGLMMSASWGLFWLAVGTVGVTRGTCSWRVLLNSVAVAAIPLLLGFLLIWLRGSALAFGLAYGLGLSVMPLVLIGFGLRQAPDGQRAGTRMLDGVRHLVDELLGKHHGCGGCGQEHDQGHGGCG